MVCVECSLFYAQRVCFVCISQPERGLQQLPGQVLKVSPTLPCPALPHPPHPTLPYPPAPPCSPAPPLPLPLCVPW